MFPPVYWYLVLLYMSYKLLDASVSFGINEVSLSLSLSLSLTHTFFLSLTHSLSQRHIHIIGYWNKCKKRSLHLVVSSVLINPDKHV